ILAILVIAATVVIVRSFLMPWAEVSTSATKVASDLTNAASTNLKDSPVAAKFIKKLEKVTDAIGEFGDVEVKSEISGYDIPTMVNKKTSKVALSLVAILFKSAENLDKKSYLVYLMPLVAILCSLLAVIGVRRRWSIIAMCLVSGAISIGGIYNLKTTALPNAFVAITIQPGLWYTMYGYLAIFIISIVWMLLGRKKEA
ncbi:MAG: hypothetical protein HQ579_02590, partial [Candidatus Omnitrophica bacterium]|nr:hypothetical protein [Candidatus Omnitrophota bacterium]